VEGTKGKEAGERKAGETKDVMYSSARQQNGRWKVKEGQKEEGEDDDANCVADDEDCFGVGARGGGRMNSAVADEVEEVNVMGPAARGSRPRWQTSRKKLLPPCYRLQS
jgi:hypothetical protein